MCENDEVFECHANELDRRNIEIAEYTDITLTIKKSCAILRSEPWPRQTLASTFSCQAQSSIVWWDITACFATVANGPVPAMTMRSVLGKAGDTIYSSSASSGYSALYTVS